MYRLYDDLRSRLGGPKWHDDNGVPRYCDFHPSQCGIYDTHVALLEIACQACGQRFLVSDSWDNRCDIEAMARLPEFARKDYVMGPELPTPESPGSFGFGDAPWHGEQQCSGTTMTTITLRVVEFWTHDLFEFEWRRRPEYEFTFPEEQEQAE